MNKVGWMDNYENCVVSVEKYLIGELAKYHEVEDLNVYFTHDFVDLLKVNGDKEYVQEQIHEELQENIAQGLESQDTEEHGSSKCLTFV